MAPFSVVRRLLGEHAAPATPEPASAAAPPSRRDLIRAAKIGYAVQSAARRTPWRSNCYAQALTARALLRVARIPHAITFGVRRGDAGELLAHVWVRAGEVTVTGGSPDRWSGVATFSWAP